MNKIYFVSCKSCGKSIATNKPHLNDILICADCHMKLQDLPKQIDNIKIRIDLDNKLDNLLLEAIKEHE